MQSMLIRFLVLQPAGASTESTDNVSFVSTEQLMKNKESYEKKVKVILFLGYTAWHPLTVSIQNVLCVS